MRVVAIPLTWSIYTAAMFRDFSPKTLTFDCQMAQVCEERFQRLVMSWLHSLRVVVVVVVDSPLLSEGESGSNSANVACIQSRAGGWH